MKERKDKHFVKKPSYPGGRDGLRKFIKTNLKYPSDAIEKKVEGTVSVKYTINHKGVVTEAHVVGGLGSGCDEEAIRLTRLLRFNAPKNPRNLRVTFHKDIHIHFRLPKQRPVKASPKVQYTYVSPTAAKNAPTSSKSFTYTINLPPK